MQKRSKIMAGAVLALLAMGIQAHAACKLTGKWRMGQNAGNKDNETAIDCAITIKANGNYTGTCTAFSTGNARSQGAVNGTLKASAACVVTGTINTTAFPLTTIRGGYVNGNYGYFVGTRGNINNPAQVRMGVLVRVAP